MPANKINLVLEQGASFHFEASILDANNVPQNFGTYTGQSQMRKSIFSNTAYPFTVTLATGLVSLDMDSSITTTIWPGYYVYDVFIYDSGSDETIRLIAGQVTVTGKVTTKV